MTAAAETRHTEISSGYGAMALNGFDLIDLKAALSGCIKRREWRANCRLIDLEAIRMTGGFID